MDAIRVNGNVKVNQVSSRTQLVRSDSNLIDFFIGDNMKRCSKCRQFKSLLEFSKDKSRKDRLYPQCKKCHKQYTQLHEVERSEYHRKYRQTIEGRLRQAWAQIRYRCNNPKCDKYKYYGGRGIKVKFVSFENFYEHITKELKVDPRGLTIDRIDNNGNYELGNIRFVTQLENNRNRNDKFAAKRPICK